MKPGVRVHRERGNCNACPLGARTPIQDRRNSTGNLGGQVTTATPVCSPTERDKEPTEPPFDGRGIWASRGRLQWRDSIVRFCGGFRVAFAGRWMLRSIIPNPILAGEFNQTVTLIALARCTASEIKTIAMARTNKLDLSTLDGRLLDGLNFCRRVYALFDQTRAGANGIANLRLRPMKLEKRLIEELIPLARYVQARYREGRRIKVRWFSGSQPYDAILLLSGAFVDNGYAPKKVVVEVTTSVHQNEHLTRELLHEQGHSFGVKGISRDRKSRAIVST